MSKNLVLMFVKEPRLGFVKTRLSKNVGNEFTLDLYKHFVKDLVDTLIHNEYDLKLCSYPTLELVNQTFGNFENFLQVVGDLGLKMQKAFEHQFENGYEKIVLIGSDTPHISNEIIDETFNKLDISDIVLGPSRDGGYYLIAFNNTTFNEEVFNNISWSTSEVLNQTLQKLHTKKVHLLQELNDIDTIEDLNDFYDEFHNGHFKESNTIRYLKEDLSWKSLM